MVGWDYLWAPSQIVMSRRFGVGESRLVRRSQGQGVERFGRSEAGPFIAFYLALSEHGHQLNASKGGLS